MSTVAALILWFAVVCYAVLGGADYGAGFWDLTAGGAKRGARARALIDHAMAPVWEANNVWLIFALVVLWTAFPPAFASIMSTLFVPISLAAAGIVLRGCAFVFRKPTQALTGRRLLGVVFALSSIMTPFFLGATFGAIAGGRVRAGDPGGDPLSAWTAPLPVLVGVLAVLCAAFLAAVFLVFDARRALDDHLSRYFRWRALGSAVAAGLVAILGIFVLRRDAPFVFHGLVREGLPFIVISAACGLATMVMLERGASRMARWLAVGAVVAVLAGWGVSQYPYLLPTSLTIEEGAGAPATLIMLFVVFLVAAVTVVPALAFLFKLDLRSRLQEGARLAGQPTDRRHRVVVVGGGFGGLFATRALGWSPVDVTLVDRQPHHLFQPLLYQVATGILSEGEIAPSLRYVLRDQKNAAVVLGDVTGFDLERRVVHAQSADGGAKDIPYDSLIVAAGAGQSYFGHDEMAAHAPGMKTLADALQLRRRLLQALEMAEVSEDPKERAGWLTVAIVGAGPTGCEISGQIHPLVTRVLGTSFRRIDPAQIRVLLVDAGREPLAQFGDQLSQKAAHALANLGVELRMGVRVTAVDEEGFVVESKEKGSERIDARTVIWAAGVQASPLAKMLAEASGAVCDRAGRIEVRPDCTLPDHPEVFAIGDMASLEKLPGVAEVAMQQGLYAARTVRRRIAGDRPPPAFRYRDLGSMATIGRFRAVVSFKGLHLAGVLGWLAWLVVHITFLTGFTNRLGTLFRWARTFLGSGRSELAYSARFGAPHPRR